MAFIFQQNCLGFVTFFKLTNYYFKIYKNFKEVNFVMFSAFFFRLCLFLRKYDQVDSVNALIDSPEIWAVSQEKGRYFFSHSDKKCIFAILYSIYKGGIVPIW